MEFKRRAAGCCLGEGLIMSKNDVYTAEAIQTLHPQSKRKEPNPFKVMHPSPSGHGMQLSFFGHSHEEGTHIWFAPLRKELGKKTRIWDVLAKDGGTYLGQIRWFARWYQYALFPAAGTVFEKTCLTDIANFCIEQTAKQTRNWKSR